MTLTNIGAGGAAGTYGSAVDKFAKFVDQPSSIACLPIIDALICVKYNGMMPFVGFEAFPTMKILLYS